MQIKMSKLRHRTINNLITIVLYLSLGMNYIFSKFEVQF
jgi:hypothetical protein